MTAALTTLSHGKTPSAEVEFFTQADIENIKANYDEYNRQWDDRYRTALAREQQRKTRSRSPEERAKSRANREMRENVELSAAHEQYEKMEATGESLTENRLLEFSSDSDLQAQLEAYVGADGRYMPFTKSVNIRLPQENLKDIEIVDTPGINDPVQSREGADARTLEPMRCGVGSQSVGAVFEYCGFGIDGPNHQQGRYPGTVCRGGPSRYPALRQSEG